MGSPWMTGIFEQVPADGIPEGIPPSPPDDVPPSPDPEEDPAPDEPPLLLPDDDVLPLDEPLPPPEPLELEPELLPLDTEPLDELPLLLDVVKPPLEPLPHEAQHTTATHAASVDERTTWDRMGAWDSTKRADGQEAGSSCPHGFLSSCCAVPSKLAQEWPHPAPVARVPLTRVRDRPVTGGRHGVSVCVSTAPGRPARAWYHSTMLARAPFVRVSATLAALGVVAVHGDARADPPPSQTPVVVAAMGDSLTDARVNGGKYLDVLRRHCPRSRFDNYGKGGEMVNQMRRRFTDDLFAPGKPAYTHVIVFGGVNDLYSDLTAGRTPALIERDLTAMYETARRHGAKVVAITVTPWGGFTRYFNESRLATTLETNRWILAQRVAGTIDAAVDAYPLLSCGDPTSLCPRYAAPFHDGLHFGPEGHEKLGEQLFAQVFASCA
jgi:lysophospholipase L1-like esterase